MTINLGVIMDPIQSIKPWKDSTFAMLLEAQNRGWNLWYMEQPDLFLENNRIRMHVKNLQVSDSASEWFTLGSSQTFTADRLDVILMRKDPPFDMRYIYTTYLLELAGQQDGPLVVNNPRTLRDANEKLSTAWFPQCCPPTLVSSQAQNIQDFINTHEDIILKPLDGMGGASIFRIRNGDTNTNVIIETLTEHGSLPVMAQRFIPEISDGDKRILIVNGETVPYALARIPVSGENRGNLAAGGSGIGQPLTDHDLWIANEVAPVLKQRGILFAGIDVIGDYLTEINITSPTCIRELDKQFHLNISAMLMDSIEEKINV